MDNICDGYNYCPEYAMFRYKNKNYCDDCLLEALENEREIQSYEYTIKSYSYVDGDYIGEDREETADIISDILENVAGIEIIEE